MIGSLLPILFLWGLPLQTPAGQAAVTTAASPAKLKTVPAPYFLAADDVLAVKVINFDNLSTSIIVPPDGNIVVPLLEPIQVTGMTTEDLRQTLVERWRKYVVNPSVSVTLTQKRHENVLFYGFVSRVGTIEYRTTLHLMEALAEVGGAAANGDLTRVTLTRKSGERTILNLDHPETKGGTSVDLPMEPGDVIYVPERRTQVDVLGEVNRPGSLDYKEDMRVLDALTAAGGVRETADLAGATLLHDGNESKLDLEALLRHGDVNVNVKLAAGDRIMLPEIRNRTYIFGAVGSPGYYNFKEGDRVLDALRASGGPTHEANLAKINVIRISKAKNTAQVQTVNIDKVLKKGVMAGNIPLEPGDILFIPDKKRGFQLQDIFGVLSSLNLVDSLAHVFTKGLGN